MKRPTWHQYFIQMAISASDRGTCPRAKVGTVLVYQEHYPVSTGYNGSDPGEPHCVDVGCLIEHGHCLRTRHSEANAIRIAQEILHLDTRGMWLYCTYAACLDCAKLIVASGISKFFYLKPYTPTAGLEYLSSHIYTEKITL